MRKYPPPPPGFRMEFKKIVNENLFPSRLSVPFLAERFADGKEKRLQHWVQSYFGVPVNQYIVAARMEQAERQLRNRGAKHIYEIGEEVGYFNYDYFKKQFEWHYGMTPLEYKEYCKQFPLPELEAVRNPCRCCPNCGYSLSEM